MLGLILINSQVSNFNSFICFLPRLIILQSTMYSFWILGMHVWPLKKRYRVYSKHSLHFQSCEKLTALQKSTYHTWNGNKIKWLGWKACVFRHSMHPFSRILSWENSVFFPLNWATETKKGDSSSPCRLGSTYIRENEQVSAKQLGSILVPLLICTGRSKWSR